MRDRGVLLEESIYLNRNATIPPDVGMTKTNVCLASFNLKFFRGFIEPNYDYILPRSL